MQRQRERQLGEHDRKVPAIAVPGAQPAQPNVPGKRKLDNAGDGRNTKTARPMPLPPKIPLPPRAPKGRRAGQPSAGPPPSGLIAPSKEGPGYNNPATGQPNAPANAPTGPRHQNDGSHPLPRRPPPPMRKKKPADPFIRPKRR
ncbi:hypothetical protein KEM55_000371 [Ascosphaera atra]|nr:hypothetical protein KEM55_000371 [Ascosphaera atra]